MTLSAPSAEEVALAQRFVSRCYPALPTLARKGRIFLVPHAGVEESRICTAAALAYLPLEAQALLVGVDHQKKAREKGEQNGNFVRVDPTLGEIDHSLAIPAAFLGSASRSPSPHHIYSSLSPGADPVEAAALLAEWLRGGKSRVVVFSVDLSHYQKNQDRVLREEESLIESLLHGDPDKTKESLSTSLTVDGPAELLTLAHLVQRLGLGWNGLVACYTDSLGRRDGWSTVEGPEAVSYAGMVWTESIRRPGAMTAFEESLLVAYARSAVGAAALGNPPPHFPSWSDWTRLSQGAFVGAKWRGEVTGSIGRYQSRGRSTAQNVAAAAADIPADSASRWGRVIGAKPGSRKHNFVDAKEIDKLEIYVNLLQPEEEWEEREAGSLPGTITPGDNWGLFLRLPSGKAATYLPSVWAEQPETSIEQLLGSLSQKAGEKKDSWKETGAKVRLYKTKLLALC